MIEQDNVSRKIKSAIILLLLSLLIIFTLQNSESISVVFFFWQMSLPRALLFFLMFIVGFLCGLAVNNWKKLIGRE